MNWQNKLYEQIKDKPQTGFFAQLEREISDKHIDTNKSY